MWTILLSIVLGFIVGSCFYGKKVWDKRLEVLGITAIIMLVSVVSMSFIIRPTLAIQDSITRSNEIRAMYIPTDLLMDDSLIDIKCQNAATTLIIKNPKFDIDDYNANTLLSRGVRNDTLKTDTGFFIKEVYRDEVLISCVIYGKNQDQLGFVQYDKSDDEWETDDWSIDNHLKIIPIPKSDTVSTPRIERVTINYENNFKWIVSTILEVYNGYYYCIYIPQKDYDILPESVKSTCYFPGYSEYLEQIAQNK